MPPRCSRRVAVKATDAPEETKQGSPGATAQGQSGLPLRAKGKRRASQVEELEEGPSRKKGKEEPKVPQLKPLQGDELLKDLEVDYTTRIKIHSPERPKKQTWKKVRTPITDRKKAPKGWNSREPDLEEE